VSVNPDHALIREIVQGRPTPVRVETNPLARLLAMEVVEIDAEGICLAFEVGETFSQGANVIQGGAQSILLDFGLAWAVMARLDLRHTVASVGINVHYLRPAPVGRYAVRGYVDRLGKSIAVAHAELLTADGVKVASASSSLAVRAA